MKYLRLLAAVSLMLAGGCAINTQNEEPEITPEPEILTETAEVQNVAGTERTWELENGTVTVTVNEDIFRCEVREGRLHIFDPGSSEPDLETGLVITFDDGFAVCGTGLETKDIIVNGVHGHLGYYDGNKDWEYALFMPQDGTRLAIYKTGPDRDENFHKEADRILTSVIIED